MWVLRCYVGWDFDGSLCPMSLFDKKWKWDKDLFKKYNKITNLPLLKIPPFHFIKGLRVISFKIISQTPKIPPLPMGYNAWELIHQIPSQSSCLFPTTKYGINHQNSKIFQFHHQFFPKRTSPKGYLIISCWQLDIVFD